MPRATVDIQETRHVDLKSLPEGFVVLKRMGYGAYLRRQEMAMSMMVEGQTADNAHMSMSMNNEAVTRFEFQECVVEHNLTDQADQPLDFRNPMTLKMLDPKIGSEISQAIQDLIGVETDLKG